eukprot:Anaeramoba_flamelloidesc31301_g1_i1.p2 GENE.c31301_g1_i1~~c31301_g1_i1.p2  ORF type:complete len:128 (+),score=1.65 c31301_g1_i1:678-1061(+)
MTIPTIGFNVETIEHGNDRFTIWDVCAGLRIRPLWRHYYSNTQAIIWVIDTHDTYRERINESYEWLMTVINDDQIKMLPLLVFANKIDLPNSMSKETIIHELQLNNLDIPWYVQPCCARTCEGLYEG